MAEKQGKLREMSKWAISGIIGGFILLVASVVRYGIIYDDYSRLILTCLVGALIMGVSYLYDERLQVIRRLNQIEDWLDTQVEYSNVIFDK